MADKQPSKKELYDAAQKKDQADWKPLEAAKRFVTSTLTDSPEYKAGKMTVDAIQEGAKNAKMNQQVQDQLQTDRNEKAYQDYEKRRAAGQDYKKGGAIKAKCSCGGGKMAKGGKVSSASKRADGIAIRGKTRA